MALLIDGYNLLHVTDIFGKAGPGSDLHRSRLALLDFLGAVDQRTRASGDDYRVRRRGAHRRDYQRPLRMKG